MREPKIPQKKNQKKKAPAAKRHQTLLSPKTFRPRHSEKMIKKLKQWRAYVDEANLMKFGRVKANADSTHISENEALQNEIDQGLDFRQKPIEKTEESNKVLKEANEKLARSAIRSPLFVSETKF